MPTRGQATLTTTAVTTDRHPRQHHLTHGCIAFGDGDKPADRVAHEVEVTRGMHGAQLDLPSAGSDLRRR